MIDETNTYRENHGSIDSIRDYSNNIVGTEEDNGSYVTQRDVYGNFVDAKYKCDMD